MKADDALNAHVFWTDPAKQRVLWDSHDSSLIEPGQCSTLNRVEQQQLLYPNPKLKVRN
jgi:hypothetical protein